MARIRSVHPGLWTDEAFVELTFPARLLYIGLWTEADDFGVFKWHPKTIKMRIFPADAIEVEPLLNELLQCEVLCARTREGMQIGIIRNFRKWQKPNRPSAPIVTIDQEIAEIIGLAGEFKAPPPNGSGQFSEGSLSTHGVLPPRAPRRGGEREIDSPSPKKGESISSDFPEENRDDGTASLVEAAPPSRPSQDRGGSVAAFPATDKQRLWTEGVEIVQRRLNLATDAQARSRVGTWLNFAKHDCAMLLAKLRDLDAGPPPDFDTAVRAALKAKPKPPTANPVWVVEGTSAWIAWQNVDPQPAVTSKHFRDPGRMRPSEFPEREART